MNQKWRKGERGNRKGKEEQKEDREGDGEEGDGEKGRGHKRIDLSIQRMRN